FGLGEAAPDAVRLADAERVVEALGLHRALVTDRLGLGLAGVALVLALGGGRREEEDRLRTAARGAHLPRPLRHLDRHGPSRSIRRGDRIPLPCTRQGPKRAVFDLLRPVPPGGAPPGPVPVVAGPALLGLDLEHEPLDGDDPDLVAGADRRSPVRAGPPPGT